MIEMDANNTIIIECQSLFIILLSINEQSELKVEGVNSYTINIASII